MANRMYLQLAALLCAVFFSLSYAEAINIEFPALAGKHAVGTVDLEFSSATGRDIMISLYYPTKGPLTGYSQAQAYPPKSAEKLSLASHFEPGNVLYPRAQAYDHAPISPKPFPTVIFSPDFASTRLLYCATAENLASLGFVVVVVDHPADALFIEYPGGKFIAREVTNVRNKALNPDRYLSLVEARARDISDVLDHLSNHDFVSQIPGINTRGKFGKLEKLQTSKVGIIGHGLGGSTAAAVMSSDNRFSAGVNMEGFFVGKAKIENPFMLMGSEEKNSVRDTTWNHFSEHSTGYKKEVRVKGSISTSFSDTIVLANELAAKELSVPSKNAQKIQNSIEGKRMLEIQAAYVGAFFGKWLKTNSKSFIKDNLLNGPSKEFPEVTVTNLQPGIRCARSKSC